MEQGLSYRGQYPLLTSPGSPANDSNKNQYFQLYDKVETLSDTDRFLSLSLPTDIAGPGRKEVL